MNRVLRNACTNTSRPLDWCKTLTVGSADTVYPFIWQDTGKMMQESMESFSFNDASPCNDAYAVHYYNTQVEKGCLQPQSILSALFARSCPLCFPGFTKRFCAEAQPSQK